MMPTQALAAVPFCFVVVEEDRDLFNQLRDSLLAATDPSGALEGIAFHRLLTAAWNLHRVQKAEANLMVRSAGADPLAHPDTSVEAGRFVDHGRKFQSSYDRALKELASLQTRRALQNFPAAAPPLADPSKIQHFAKQSQSAELGALKTEYKQLQTQAEDLVIKSFSEKPLPSTAAPADVPGPIARGALCPCGSREKYKRCCGKNAPPVLNGGVVYRSKP